MGKLLLFGVCCLLVWAYRSVTLVPSRKRKPTRPTPTPARQTAPSPHEVLGVPSTATNEEIRRAYHNQIRLHHPDRVAALGPEKQRAAEQQTAALNAAYDLLCPK